MRHGRVRNGLEARIEGKAGAGRRRIWLGLEHNPAAIFWERRRGPRMLHGGLIALQQSNLNQHVALVDHCVLEGSSHCLTNKRVQGRMRWQRQACSSNSGNPHWQAVLTHTTVHVGVGMHVERKEDRVPSKSCCQVEEAIPGVWIGPRPETSPVSRRLTLSP